MSDQRRLSQWTGNPVINMEYSRGCGNGVHGSLNGAKQCVCGKMKRTWFRRLTGWRYWS